MLVNQLFDSYKLKDMNTTFSGTKGNWKQFYNGYFYDIKTSEDGYCQTFARVDENAYLPVDKKTNERNACLIATAPRLLEMLEDCVSFLRDIEVPEYLKETYGNLIMNAEATIVDAINP